MRSWISALVIVAAMATAVAGQQPAPKMGFTLTSPSFPDGGEIPYKYTQADPNPVSPKFQWSYVPENTAAFVMIMTDANGAPQKKAYPPLVHSMLLNIPGTARELPEGIPMAPQLPDGTIQPKNVRGEHVYRPPGALAPGPHHYYMWELFALDKKLDLTPDATYEDVVKAMDGHVLGKAVVVGRFHRP